MPDFYIGNYLRAATGRQSGRTEGQGLDVSDEFYELMSRYFSCYIFLR